MGQVAKGIPKAPYILTYPMNLVCAKLEASDRTICLGLVCLALVRCHFS